MRYRYAGLSRNRYNLSQGMVLPPRRRLNGDGRGLAQ
jgi:hypothetical protein